MENTPENQNFKEIATIGICNIDGEEKTGCKFHGMTFNLSKTAVLAMSFISAAIQSSTTTDPEKKSSPNTLSLEIEAEMSNLFAGFRSSGDDNEHAVFRISALSDKEGNVTRFASSYIGKDGHRVLAAEVIMSIHSLYESFTQRLEDDEQRAEFRQMLLNYAKSVAGENESLPEDVESTQE